MSHVVAFGRFWWDFIIGDDWTAAAGVAAALILTGIFATWWVLPPAVALVLALSLLRSIRREF